MWIYNDVEFTEADIGDNYGFVYEIMNLKNNRKYIGKKFFWSQKTKQVKGKKKRIKVYSDWETYYGSNEELKKDVEELGKENFQRKILFLCKSKGVCGYIEAREQFKNNVLESDEYYNSWIMVRVHQKHLGKLC